MRALRADVHELRSELAAMREEMRHFFTGADEFIAENVGGRGSREPEPVSWEA